jgi:hypothetical protein
VSAPPSGSCRTGRSSRCGPRRTVLGSVLPGPIETLRFIAREYERGTLLFHLWITTQRVLVAFVVALDERHRARRRDGPLAPRRRPPAGLADHHADGPPDLAVRRLVPAARAQRPRAHHRARDHRAADDRRLGARGHARDRRQARRDGARLPARRAAGLVEGRLPAAHAVHRRHRPRLAGAVVEDGRARRAARAHQRRRVPDLLLLPVLQHGRHPRVRRHDDGAARDHRPRVMGRCSAAPSAGARR